MKQLHHNTLSWQIILFGIALTVSASCTRSPEAEFTVMKGEFVQSVTETGELHAIKSTRIFVPPIDSRFGYRFKLVGLTDHGTIVQEGDSVAAIDPSNIQRAILQQQEALENAKGQAEKQRVQSEIQQRDLEVQMRNEESSYDLVKLELDRMQFESEIKKKVKELEFEKATIRLEKVKKKLALYPVLEKYDRFINELRVRQYESDIQKATQALQKMVLFSPGNGYFEIGRNRNTGQNFKLGDEASIGTMIASIPDISHMKASSFINEMDISKVKEGARVVIRLDALPDLTFKGKVEVISLICIGQSNQKVFTTEISIEDRDSRLKPGMSISCEYICYESEDELYVPNECLMNEGEKTYLFIKKGNKFRKTEVNTGVSNAHHTIIYSNLKPGRELLSLDQDAAI